MASESKAENKIIFLFFGSLDPIQSSQIYTDPIVRNKLMNTHTGTDWKLSKNTQGL